jgi:3-(3-hydroxy-phenyl)propionate hydroxylase
MSANSEKSAVTAPAAVSMASSSKREVYPYKKAAEIDATTRRRVPVIIVGAGPVGLTAAVELSMRGISCLVLDEDDTVSVGSRAICYAKRTLEIWDRLEAGDVMLDKGVTWNLGRVYFGDAPEPVYSFNLLPEEGHKFPAFINLQQYYSEEFLIDALKAGYDTDIRWKSRVTGVASEADGVTVTVESPDGAYQLDCDYLIAADGSRSPIRHMLGLEFEGEVFKDHFLIADIKMKKDLPTERRFYFDPPFNRGQSALIHKQPDDVWRLDFQLGWDIDREVELKPENVTPRIKAMLGQDLDFTYEWVSIYTFQCRQLDRFVHGRVIFVGDAAHLVSPFGARGANSGVQDIDNLGWKLQLVMAGKAPAALLESYNDERVYAARENILNSTRATDFITPKSEVSRAFRDAVLILSKSCDFARRLVNSGRLSVPAILKVTSLSTPDAETFEGWMDPGTPCADAPVRAAGRDDWFLTFLARDNGGKAHPGKAFGGTGFTALYFAGKAHLPEATVKALAELEHGDIPVKVYVVTEAAFAAEGLALIEDAEGYLRQRYDGRAGTVYLLRPDHHVAARWRQLDKAKIKAAVDKAIGRAKK